MVQGEGDVGSVHVRDRVHDQGDGDDAQPASFVHGGPVFSVQYSVSSIQRWG